MADGLLLLFFFRMSSKFQIQIQNPPLLSITRIITWSIPCRIIPRRLPRGRRRRAGPGNTRYGGATQGVPYRSRL
jgi:hypothetical protein